MNIYGVKGYLTPDDLPEDRHCRTFKIPNDVQWLSVFMGALLPLIYPESWQESGALTPDEAADGMLDVIWDAYANDEGECPTVPTPFWDEVTDLDDEYPEGELTPWYGIANVTYASPPDVDFVEKLGIWTIAGFLVYAGQPGAAIAFLTVAPKFVIAFKTGDIGAIVDIIIDSSRVGSVNTYSASPGVLRVAVTGNPDLDSHQLYLVKDDDPDTVLQVIRDELNPNDVSPSNRRYIAETDQVQVQGADGSWGDNPGADPRSSPAYQYPPIDADDPRCQAAANMSRWINNLIDQVLTVIAECNDAAGLLTILTGVLLELGPFGILIDLILALAFVLFSAGATAISAAFTNDVYDQLTCIFYCNIGTDGTVTAEQLATIQSQIDSMIGGLVGTVLDAMLFLMGNVGLTNAGTIGSAPADCSDCGCAWVSVDSFCDSTVGDWTRVYGVLTADGLEMETDAGGWPSVARVDQTIVVPASTTIDKIGIWFNSQGSSFNHLYILVDSVIVVDVNLTGDGLANFDVTPLETGAHDIIIEIVNSFEGVIALIAGVRWQGTGDDFMGHGDTPPPCAP